MRANNRSVLDPHETHNGYDVLISFNIAIQDLSFDIFLYGD